MNPRIARLLSALGPLFGLLFVIAIFSASPEVRPFFLTGGNFKIILTQPVIVAVGALWTGRQWIEQGVDRAGPHAATVRIEVNAGTLIGEHRGITRAEKVVTAALIN